MGAVYRASQISLDRPVAIKLLPPALWHADAGFAERFRNEARVMARLSHPGIVSVHDFGSTSDRQLYFVMEYVHGTDVARMLLKEKRLAPLHALAITAHVCDALSYAHRNGVIHRDIKPGNVMVDHEGRVKVADFGLAGLAAHESASAEETMTMGTPDYVAPEALVVGVTVDARADLYALGVMLYEMITGKVPHKNFVPASMKLAGLDGRFDKIIQRALQRDPAKRYATAAEFRADLDRIVSTPVERAKSSPSSSRSRVRGASLPIDSDPQSRARGIPWSLVAGAVTVIVGTIALIMWKPAAAPSEHHAAAESSTASAPEAANSPTLAQPQPASANSRIPAPSAPGAVSPSSPPSLSEVTKRLLELDTSFQAALERDVTNAFNTPLSDLAFDYLAVIQKGQATAKALGNTTELPYFAEEKRRIENHLPLPDDDAFIPESLRKLRASYRASKSRMELDRKKVAVGLYNKYQDVLAAYQLELTKAGKLEDAVQVTDKRRELAVTATHLDAEIKASW